jgi:LEA14-like dessication related protein
MKCFSDVARLVAGAVLVAIALGLGACAALKPKPPEVSLSAVRFVEIGLAEQRFILVLRVQNPNGRDFTVSGLAYEAEVGGKPFAKGVSNQRTVLAAYGETLLEVPATARFAHLFKGLLGGLDALLGGKEGAGELDYRVHGTIEVDGFGTLPFDRKGKVRIGPEKKSPALPDGART